MSELNIETLKAAALAATPGEWKAGGTHTQCTVKDADGVLVAAMSWHHSHRKDYTLQAESVANALYIAAANPVTILALIAELEDTKKKLARWKDYSGVQDA